MSRIGTSIRPDPPRALLYSELLRRQPPDLFDKSSTFAKKGRMQGSLSEEHCRINNEKSLRDLEGMHENRDQKDPFL